MSRDNLVGPISIALYLVVIIALNFGFSQLREHPPASLQKRRPRHRRRKNESTQADSIFLTILLGLMLLDFVFKPIIFEYFLRLR